MIDDLVLCTRAVEKNKFSNEPGEARFLHTPADQLPSPKHEVSKRNAWSSALRREAKLGKNPRTVLDRSDILIFMHGSTNGHRTMLGRHRPHKTGSESFHDQHSIYFDSPNMGTATSQRSETQLFGINTRFRSTALALLTDTPQLDREQNME